VPKWNYVSQAALLNNLEEFKGNMLTIQRELGIPPSAVDPIFRFVLPLFRA
jgi:hypothetical protein